MLTKKQLAERDKDAALASLKLRVNRHDPVYMILRHTARGGMSRVIDVYIPVIIKTFNQDGEGRDAPRLDRISGTVADALGMKLHPEHDGIKVYGVGMDMGGYLVRRLSAALFDDDYALKKEWL